MMSEGAALTEYILKEKLFTWKISNYNLIEKLSLIDISDPAAFLGIYLLKSPTMTAFDPDTGLEYTATISLKFLTFPCTTVISMECSPKLDSYQFDCQINDNEMIKGCSVLKGDDETIKNVSIFVRAVIKKDQSFVIKPFKSSNNVNVAEKLKEMWENDSSNKFEIKCGQDEVVVKAIKPFLSASSPVFKAMFETEMKESFENCVIIKEFEPKIVEKMIEFCQTNTINEIENEEENLFKIAHKYQISDLMNFAVEKMAENISTENIQSRLQLATLYDLKAFKKWYMQFALCNNIDAE
jgi:antitoxin component of MazEF toxin-antitoxin module